MRLADLLADLDVSGDVRPDVEIRGVAEDSRCVRPGDLFIARQGASADGRRFIPDAIDAGAVAVLTDRSDPSISEAAHLISVNVPLVAARIAERFHRDPSRLLALVGVTGTNGKTTVVGLVHQLLMRHQIPCGLIGTVHVDDGSGPVPADLTTPPAIELSGLLRRMVDNGCDACAMEASSHALHQRRTAGLAFDGAVFTNLSGDHMDYHGSMEAYIDAKALLFDAIDDSGWGVINVDDPAAMTMIGRCRGEIITTSLTDPAATGRAVIGALGASATRAQFEGPWGSFEIDLPLVGRHNVANALQAAAVAHRLGLDRTALADGLRTCTAPAGRLQPITTADDPFAVLVDYAHTDDALDNVMRALRPIVPDGGRLCVVFGCGGDRDRTKRPRMAEVACRWSDVAYITSDNPRTENPQSIIDDIVPGVPSERLAQTPRIVDRAEAIRAAIDDARAGDVIVIAGKGHEDYQIVGTTKRHFDDREVAAAALAARRDRAEALT
jgi:UDP-N-acetylmuramoyl-L-alanyl-D-glutamate--2,6-diaminopimelate ligase